MQSFSEQCLDMARSILGHNLNAINPDGTISPIEGEPSRLDESGHAALAIGEFFRATGETSLEEYDLIDLSARCITQQAFRDPPQENGLAFAALGLLSFGPAKERNPVWERLVEQTREQLDRLLLARSDYTNHWQAFNIAKAVTRFSMGLSKKDETGKLIDRFLERIGQKSSNNFFDDGSETIGGTYNIYGVLSFVFIRQALQLHANLNLRDRKLPSLRTFGEKYLKLLPDLVREDGLGWSYGRGLGLYGQMHLISLILQGMRDGWIGADKWEQYSDLLRRLFQFFFVNFLDQENGYVVIRDGERDTIEEHTTRMGNFDAARYLCQWSRLSRTLKSPSGAVKPKSPTRATGKFVVFDKSARKEQGVFLYRNPDSGLHLQLPLSSQNGSGLASTMAFPHAQGIFDWPVNAYLPILVPELSVEGRKFVPSFYGKRCVTGLGLRNSFYFRYEQPEWITKEEEIVNGLGSVKVNWTFSGDKITSEFAYTVKQKVQIDSMRYCMALAYPHSTYASPNSLALGAEGHRCNVEKDDFLSTWKDTEVVSDDPQYKTNWGNIHYLQVLSRDHPLIMRPGNVYRLTVSFEPDITLAEA
ncbi:MAG: hypothetical protein LAT58_09335 [Opitutales bacterium]|nr:hypothetical protein [Opitutales bacterium]